MATATAPEVLQKVPVPTHAPTSTRPSILPVDDSPESHPGTVGARNLLIILHGKRVDDDLVRDALLELKQQGHQVSVRVTFDRGDVEAFVAEAILLNERGRTAYQTIVAGGGDGTLNEVVGALMNHREAIQRQGLSVALLPLGTANDFACAAGISVAPREALQVALDPALIRPIDVGLVNGCCFLNVAVAGGVAAVPPEELASKWKRLLGPLAIGFYVLKRLLGGGQSLQPHASTRISFNPEASSARGHSTHADTDAGDAGSLTLQTDLLMLVAGNSRQMGRTVSVCPDALLDDGLLDFTLLTGASLAAQAAVLAAALTSHDDAQPAHNSGICQLRASRLEVVSGSPSDNIPINRDGEPEEASNRHVFEVLPRALPMHLPDDRLLTAGQRSTRRCASGSNIRGSIKPAGSEAFVPAAAAVKAKGKAAASKQGSRARRHHRHLTVRTLKRMLMTAGPEGAAVRRAARLVAAGKRLCGCLVLVVLGGWIGWSARSRQTSSSTKGGDSPAGAQQRQRSGRGNRAVAA